MDVSGTLAPADQQLPEPAGLSVFYGRASPAEVQLYARWSGPAGADAPSARLQGEVHGPHCAYAQTLPLCVRLTPQPGSPPLATGCLPDPCFWSPEAPYLYRVQLEWSSADAAPQRAQRLLGVRPFGAHGTQFLWAGKRFVPRFVRPTAGRPIDWQECRSAGAALWLEHPADAECEAASRLGVLLGASAAAHEDWASEASRLARWPAVACLAVEGCSEERDYRRLQSVAPNLLIGQRLTDAATPVARGAQFIVVDAKLLLERPPWTCALPLLVRGSSPAAAVAQRRSACDELQRALVGQVDPAGYIV